MPTQIIPSFHVIGISVRTTNENGQAASDIAALWNRFLTEAIMVQIPHKISGDIYCIYTDYEKDHTQPYTVILGCMVSNPEDTPAGMIGLTIKKGSYMRFTAKGNLAQVAVLEEWVNIWNADLDRSFTADFEVYGSKAQNPENAEADIFVAVKQ